MFKAISIMKIVVFVCFLISNQATAYYFYNDKTNQIITSSSLKIPKGFRIINPPKTVTFNKDKFTKGLFCKDYGFVCQKNFNYSLTYQFECNYDNNCPDSFICCPQKCFNHKICVRGIEKSTVSAINPPSTETSCEKWPHSCISPYSYYSTHKFQCSYNQECPKGYNCCEDKCFSHKICLKAKIQQKTTITNTKFIPKRHYPSSLKYYITTPKSITTESTIQTLNDDDINTTTEVESTNKNDVWQTNDQNAINPEASDIITIDPEYAAYYDDDNNEYTNNK